MWRGWQFTYALMVPPVATGQINVEIDKAAKTSPNHLIICTFVCYSWLKCRTIGTIWIYGWDTCQADRERDISPHSVAGLYIGTSQEHYRYHKVWVKVTKIFRIGEIMLFNHKYLTNTTITTDGAINQELHDLVSALDNNIYKKWY